MPALPPANISGQLSLLSSFPIYNTGASALSSALLAAEFIFRSLASLRRRPEVNPRDLKSNLSLGDLVAEGRSTGSGFWLKVREHASNAVVGGLVLVLTGFTPEHWVANGVEALHLPRNLLASLTFGIDPRLIVVTIGVALIVGDTLRRRWHTDSPGTRGQEFPLLAAREQAARSTAADSTLASQLTLPEKPSIAVLPFQNMSGDPEQDYFADGIVEEITTALSRFPSLFVIARNSSFTYKGKSVDIKQVGRELGVRYVLEGGIRKAANQVRVTAQLIDAATGVHIWADRFEGELADIFRLQDDMSQRAVGAITPMVEHAEIERMKRKPTHRFDAYDFYLKGLASLNLQGSKDAADEALQMFYRAIDLDSGFASAYGNAAFCFVRRLVNAWMEDPKKEIVEAERLATRAVQYGSDDPVALTSGGFTLARLLGELEIGEQHLHRALELSPSYALAWTHRAWIRVFQGRPDEALPDLNRAMRLNPRDPLMPGYFSVMGMAHFVAGRYEEAASWCEKAIQVQPKFLPPLRTAAASYALAGNLQAAQTMMSSLMQLDPRRRISTLRELYPLQRNRDWELLTEGLRRAGLPD